MVLDSTFLSLFNKMSKGEQGQWNLLAYKKNHFPVFENDIQTSSYVPVFLDYDQKFIVKVK